MLGFGMRMCHSHKHELKQEQKLKLTLEQREQLKYKIFGLHLELVASLREDRFEPRGDCPKCHRKLTPMEIVKGFNQDPNDYNTTCTGCGERFPANLTQFMETGNMVISFLCPCQTLAILQPMAHLEPREIIKTNHGAYRSALIHFGNIRNAFASAGINYPHEEISGWQVKIQPFLGKMPDTHIAECVDQPVSTIGRMRRELGISRFRKQDLL